MVVLWLFAVFGRVRYVPVLFRAVSAQSQLLPAADKDRQPDRRDWLHDTMEATLCAVRVPGY